MTFSYSKKKRLLNKKDFQLMRTGSLFLVSENLLFYIKENNTEFSRLGLAITKKYGNAVCRNRAKRIVRNSFRKNIYLNSKHTSFDILVTMNMRSISKRKDSHAQIESNISKNFADTIKKKFS